MWLLVWQCPPNLLRHTPELLSHIVLLYPDVKWQPYHDVACYVCQMYILTSQSHTLSPPPWKLNQDPQTQGEPLCNRQVSGHPSQSKSCQEYLKKNICIDSILLLNWMYYNRLIYRKTVVHLTVSSCDRHNEAMIKTMKQLILLYLIVVSHAY